MDEAVDTGSRGRDFPEIEPARRAEILSFFNSGENPFFPGHMGYRVADVRQGYSRLTAVNRTETMQPAGVMHGGASFGLADTGVAVALMSIYPAGTVLLTVEMKINYLEPIPAGLVEAECWVLRSSRSSAYAEVDILAAGKLAARASTTYMIRHPK